MKAAKPSGKRQSRADLGVLGKLYPAVNGRWDTNADNLSLTDMKPKVNYKAGGGNGGGGGNNPPGELEE